MDWMSFPVDLPAAAAEPEFIEIVQGLLRDLLGSQVIDDSFSQGARFFWGRLLDKGTLNQKREKGPYRATKPCKPQP